MENKTKRSAIKIYIICGVAAGCVLACAIFFKLYMLVPLNKVHAQYDEYQRNINETSENKIISYTLFSEKRDWDPYIGYIVLKTRNNYEIYVNTLNNCNCFGLTGCESVNSGTIGIDKIINAGNNKHYELSYIISGSGGKGREMTYKATVVEANYDFKDFDDFIIKSDAIIDAMVKKIEAIDKSP